jgi:lysophospholipase L1-like esterase
MKALLPFLSLLVCMAALPGLSPAAEAAAQSSARPRHDWQPGTSPLISITDCVRVVRDEATGIASIARGLERDIGDAPGARIRFRTNSPTVSVHLRYDARQVRNSVGVFRIDGAGDPAWTFQRAVMGYPAPESDQVVELPVPGTTAMISPYRDYELILPYGDTVRLIGVQLDPEALWEMPAPRPSRRWLAFGDAITQGLGASQIDRSCVFLVAEKAGWQLINAGFGGRGAARTDGDYLAGIDADLVTIAMGVNNWQGGMELPAFRGQMTGLITRLRELKPNVPIRVITPLWVTPSWKPERAKYPLEDYTAVIREIVASLADPNVRLIDGGSLIDHDPSLFERTGLQPNDKGHAQIAERLSARLFD